jgi:hypothetical protein
MKLTKGKIAKLYSKKRQSKKKYNKKRYRKNRTLRRTRGLNLANKTLKHIKRGGDPLPRTNITQPDFIIGTGEVDPLRSLSLPDQQPVVAQVDSVVEEEPLSENIITTIEPGLVSNDENLFAEKQTYVPPVHVPAPNAEKEIQIEKDLEIATNLQKKENEENAKSDLKQIQDDGIIAKQIAENENNPSSLIIPTLEKANQDGIEMTNIQEVKTDEQQQTNQPEDKPIIANDGSTNETPAITKIIDTKIDATTPTPKDDFLKAIDTIVDHLSTKVAEKISIAAAPTATGQQNGFESNLAAAASIAAAKGGTKRRLLKRRKNKSKKRKKH